MVLSRPNGFGCVLHVLPVNHQFQLVVMFHMESGHGMGYTPHVQTYSNHDSQGGTKELGWLNSSNSMSLLNPLGLAIDTDTHTQSYISFGTKRGTVSNKHETSWIIIQFQTTIFQRYLSLGMMVQEGYTNCACIYLKEAPICGPNTKPMGCICFPVSMSVREQTVLQHINTS